MSHDPQNPFSNETGEYRQEATEKENITATEKAVDPVEEASKPRRSYKRQENK